MISLRHILSVAYLVLVAQFASAEMFVDRSIVTFDKNSGQREDIKVSNSGDGNIYVKVDVYAVNNPGSSNEERVKIANPKELGLIATPQKLVIAPNGQKLVRLVNLNRNNDAERIYRINIIPILPPLADETSQLRIVVAYQILTIVNPDNANTDLRFTREGNTINFTNTGNSNVLLNEGTQCDPEQPSICSDLPSHRLYAGNTWQVKLPFDAPSNYSVRSFDGIKKQLIP